MIVQLDGNTLTFDDILHVANGKAHVTLSPGAIDKISASRMIIENILKSSKRVYGVNTGFGKLSDVAIDNRDIDLLQQNLIKSHSVGVGEYLSEKEVRAMMLLRANALAKGYSGVRIEVVKTLIDFINKGIHPLIPSKGSVGASGDLAPSAHMALSMIGEGEASYKGKKMPAMAAMKKASINPLTLKAKEGLSLINGTQTMTAIGVLTYLSALNLSKLADIAGSMSLEALMGTDKAFDERIQHVRPHSGQIACADNLRRIVTKSEIIKSHKTCPRVQDSYSLRCMPQVHGAVKDVLNYVKKTLEIEINAATDNPLVFSKQKEIIPGGNFHGQPVALACDFLGIAMAELASISERRIERLVNPELSELPPFLVEKVGLNSGLMVAQITAASLVSENKVLAHPASVDSIPTSGNKEDHVSMGTTAARKAKEIIGNTSYVIAIEFLCASQGINFRLPLQAGRGTKKAWEVIRSEVPLITEDRIFYKDIDSIIPLMQSGEILQQVESACGPLW